MKKFEKFAEAITEIIDAIYEMSTEEHQRRIKFMSKLSREILDGGKTGNFKVDLLDSCKNIKARLNDALDRKDPSEKLQGALITFSERLDYFADTLKGLSVSEKKALYGLQYLLFLYKIRHLTFGQLYALFMELNNEQIDMEIETFEEINSLPKNNGPEIFAENEVDENRAEREETHEYQSAGVLN